MNTTKTRQSNQFAVFFALAKKLNIDPEMRMNLVRQYSKNRTGSLKELNSYEYAELIGHLNRQMPAASVPMAAKPAQPAPPAWESANVMRKKIFFLFRELGYAWGSEPGDMARNSVVVNHYVRTYGYLKCKPLNSYTAEELPKLVSQFENWKKNVDKAAAKKAVRELCKELNIPS
jgi:hypothetical protein